MRHPEKPLNPLDAARAGTSPARFIFLSIFALTIPLLGGCGEALPPQGSPPPVVDRAESFLSDPINSPPEQVPRFVDGIGWLDGVSCEHFPRDVDFRSPHDPWRTGQPEETSLPLGDILTRWPTSLSDRVAPIREFFQRLPSMPRYQSVVGSKRELRLVTGAYPLLSTPEEITLALDPAAKIGFALDQRYFCSESDASSAGCRTRPVSHGGVSYQVLTRTSSRTTDAGPAEVPLLILVAPTIVSDSPILRIDSNLVLVADRLDLESELVTAPYNVNRDPIVALSRAVIQPLVAVVARHVDDLSLNLFNTGAIARMVVTDSVAQGRHEYFTVPSEPIQGGYALDIRGQANNLRINALDLFDFSVEGMSGGRGQADLHPVDIQTTESNSTYTCREVGEWDGGGSTPSTTRTVQTMRRTRRIVQAARVNLTLRAPSRVNSTAPGNAILVCQGGGDCDTNAMRFFGTAPLHLAAPPEVQHLTNAILQGSEMHPAEWLINQLTTQETCRVVERREEDCMRPDPNWDGLGGPRYITERIVVFEEVECTTPAMIEVCGSTSTCGLGTPSDLDDLIRSRLTSFAGIDNSPLRGWVGLIGHAHLFPTDRIALAQSLLSRGYFHEVIIDGLVSDSLRSGAVDNWLWSLDELATPLGPLPTSASIDSSNLLNLDVLRDSGLRQRWLEPLVVFGERARFDGDVPMVNVLGSSHGRVRQPWQIPGYPTLGDLIGQWDDLAEDMRTLNVMIEGRIADTQTLVEIESLANAVQQSSSMQRQIDEASYTINQQFITELTSQRQELERQLGDFEDAIGQIWGCDMANDPQACYSSMEDSMEDVYRECRKQNKSSFLGDLLSFVGAVAGILGPVVQAAGLVLDTIDQISFAHLAALPDGKIKAVTDKIKDTINKVENAVSKMDKMKKFLETFTDVLNAQDCARDTAWGGILMGQMQTMQNTMAMMDSLEAQIRLVHTLSQKFYHDALLARASALAHGRIGEDVARVKDRIQRLREVQQDDIRMGALEVLELCPLGTAAIRQALRDAFVASKALRTSTGDVDIRPLIEVPGDPAVIGTLPPNPDDPRPPLEDVVLHGFHVSLWDLDRIDGRLFRSTSNMAASRSIIELIDQRFDTFQEQHCRVSGSEQAVVFAVQETLRGEALDRLLDEGLTEVTLTLDDLIRAGGAGLPDLWPAESHELGSPTMHPGSYDPAEWAPVSTPVLIGAVFRGIDTSGTPTGFSPLGSGSLQLLAPDLATVLVPSPPGGCPGDGDVISSERSLHENQPSFLEACATSVRMPDNVRFPPTQDLMTPGAAQLVRDWKQRNSTLGSTYCGSSFDARRPGSHEGWPVFGTWEVAADENVGQSRLNQRRGRGSFVPPSPSPRTLNSSLDAIEIFFIAVGEFRSRTMPSVYRGTPAP